jgi:hypothetical protein
MPELAVLQALIGVLRARLAAARADERGSPTVETVLIAAGLAAAAIAAVAIILAKVTAKANSIPTGGQ